MHPQVPRSGLPVSCLRSQELLLQASAAQLLEPWIATQQSSSCFRWACTGGTRGSAGKRSCRIRSRPQEASGAGTVSAAAVTSSWCGAAQLSSARCGLFVLLRGGPYGFGFCFGLEPKRALLKSAQPPTVHSPHQPKHSSSLSHLPSFEGHGPQGESPCPIITVADSHLQGVWPKKHSTTAHHPNCKAHRRCSKRCTPRRSRSEQACLAIQSSWVRWCRREARRGAGPTNDTNQHCVQNWHQNCASVPHDCNDGLDCKGSRSADAALC